MAEEEVVDAESGTLNKQITALDHLRHLLNIGWLPNQPMIKDFVDKYGLYQELDDLCREKGLKK